MTGSYAMVAQGDGELEGVVRAMASRNRWARRVTLALAVVVATVTVAVLRSADTRHLAAVAGVTEQSDKTRDLLQSLSLARRARQAEEQRVGEELDSLKGQQAEHQRALEALDQRTKAQADLTQSTLRQLFSQAHDHRQQQSGHAGGGADPSTPTPTPTPVPEATPSHTPTRSKAAPVPSPNAAAAPSVTATPHNQKAIPISWKGEVFWDGEYDTFPKPIPADFSGPPSQNAVGRRAYVTMVSTGGNADDLYACLGLAMLTSLQRTKPDPSIDVVLVVLVDDDDNRFREIRKDEEAFAKVTALDVLGQDWLDAFQKAGVTRFVVWKELDTRGREGMVGGWKQGFSKLRVWSLTDFEKIVFLDSDTFILKNLDHLFSEPEFTAARTWDCGNPNSSLRPSGGFWVVVPSENTWGLIQAYIAGRDPCGKLWRLGDMMMTYILFMDIESFANPDPNGWPKFDGDRPAGRCRTPNIYPARIDFLTNHNDRYHLPTGDLSPRNRWKMLNESYDVLVGPCWRGSFYGGGREWDDRYNQRRGNGSKTFDRPDAFSIHFSCGPKPPCVRDRVKEAGHHPCIVAAFDWWYDALKVHYFGEYKP